MRCCPDGRGSGRPGRLVTFSSLGLALLAGAGTELAMRACASRLGARGAPLRRRRRVLALVVVVEGRGLPFDPFDDQAQPAPPAPPADLSAVPAPQLHLPAERPEDNRRYLLWSTDGFPDDDQRPLQHSTPCSPPR